LGQTWERLYDERAKIDIVTNQGILIENKAERVKELILP
jgi:hypothetical protein